MLAFRVAAVAFGVALLPAAAGADTPLTFNVVVKVSNMLPEVEAMAVKCTVNTAAYGKVATGEGQAQLAGGAFDGVVTVAMTTSQTAQQLLNPAQPLQWECDLFAVNANGSEVLVARPGSTSIQWAAAASGSQPVNAIGGDFPPGTVYPIDTNTHMAIKPPKPDATTPAQ
ncbi:MAG TPA: hypothetical protein VHA70_15530 [Bauldia sp.]|nr:hypothetical protein [Bauldia sp.]